MRNKFSKLEGLASRAFDAGTIAHGVAYDGDFVRFLVSILWRAGTVRGADIQSARPRFVPALADGDSRCGRDILEGNRADCDGHPIWFVLLDTDLARVVDQFMKSETTNGRGAARSSTGTSPTTLGRKSPFSSRRRSHCYGRKRPPG